MQGHQQRRIVGSAESWHHFLPGCEQRQHVRASTWYREDQQDEVMIRENRSVSNKALKGGDDGIVIAWRHARTWSNHEVDDAFVRQAKELGKNWA